MIRGGKVVKDYCRKVFILLRSDLIEYIRLKMAIIVNILQPLCMMVAFGLTASNGGKEQFDVAVPGILCASIMFGVTYTIGFTTISDRERRLVDDIVLSPVSYSAFIVSRFAGAIIKTAIPFLVSLLVGVLFFQVRVEHILFLIISYVLTSIVFAGIGMAIGSFTNHLTFDGIVNFVLIPLMFFGGIFFPVKQLGKLALVIKYLPVTPSNEIFRYALSGNIMMGTKLSNMIILLLYTTGAILLGIVSFKSVILKR